MKEKSDHWTTLKLRTPVHQDTISEMASHREKIIATHIFQKELIYRMYKEHESARKRQKIPLKIGRLFQQVFLKKAPLPPQKSHEKVLNY